MPHYKNDLIKKTDRKNRFAVTPIFLPFILISIAIGIFYFLKTHEYFPFWIKKIEIVVKIFIVLEVIIGSAKTFMMPIILFLLASGLLFISIQYQLNWLPYTEIWNLIFLSFIGLIVSVLIKW